MIDEFDEAVTSFMKKLSLNKGIQITDITELSNRFVSDFPSYKEASSNKKSFSAALKRAAKELDGSLITVIYLHRVGDPYTAHVKTLAFPAITKEESDEYLVKLCEEGKLRAAPMVREPFTEFVKRPSLTEENELSEELTNEERIENLEYDLEELRKRFEVHLSGKAA